MDKESWRQAWGLFMTDPIPFGSVLFVVVSFVGGGLWYLRGFFAKSHVATLQAPIRTLEERLRLAEDEQGRVAKEIERLEEEIKKMNEALSNGQQGDKEAFIKYESTKKALDNELQNWERLQSQLG